MLTGICMKLNYRELRKKILLNIVIHSAMINK